MKNVKSLASIRTQAPMIVSTTGPTVDVYSMEEPEKCIGVVAGKIRLQQYTRIWDFLRSLPFYNK